MSDLSDHFEYTDRKIFKDRPGPAHNGTRAPCKWKLCLTATDEQYLVKLLYELSNREDCYYVKYSPSSSPKCSDGMFLGRVFLTTEDAIGKLWREIRCDPKLMCNIQDDAATEKYR